jgi:hypothetical protein
MVKAIAETHGVRMPSFFGYMAYSCGVLLPIFAVVTLVFFARERGGRRPHRFRADPPCQPLLSQLAGGGRMIKMIFLCRRRSDITRAQYAAFVLEGHAPLALRHHPTLLRYVINIAEGTPEGGPELDSLPALYFASLEDFSERLYDSPRGREIIRRDVERFMAGGADTTPRPNGCTSAARRAARAALAGRQMDVCSSAAPTSRRRSSTTGSRCTCRW